VIGLLALAAICPAQAANATRIEDPEAYAVYDALLSDEQRFRSERRAP